jgi:hypothetical protein
MGTKRELLNQYRAAWREFIHRTSELEDCALVSEPKRAHIEVALLEAEKARLAYNDARDRLVAQIAPLQPAATLPAHGVRQDGKVRAIAQRIWEFAGKPDGTALADWLQAERVVQSASTSVAR